MQGRGRYVIAVRLLQSFLGLVAVILCIRMLASLVEAPAASVGLTEEAVPIEAASRAEEGFAVITARDLFRRAKEPVVSMTSPVVESALDVALLGTIVGSGREGNSEVPGIAVVRDVDGKIVSLAKGDAFAGERARLVEIEPRRIVLEQSGRLETVTFEEGAMQGKASGRRATSSAPPRPASLPPPRTEQVARMQGEVQRRMQEPMPQVGTKATARQN